MVPLAGATDYRLERLRDLATYHQPLGPATDAKLDEAFAALTDAAAGAPEVIEVASRRLEVPKAAKGVAWFDFEALCEQPLGAADYLALTERYHTVLLSGVPRLTPDKRNQARRFITLVDALYDRRVNLIIGAAAAPEALSRGRWRVRVPAHGQSADRDAEPGPISRARRSPASPRALRPSP